MFLKLSLLIVVFAILSNESFGAAPTKAPISTPTRTPTTYPSRAPTKTPTKVPTAPPTATPTAKPSTATPSAHPTRPPTATPTTATPSAKPSASPTFVPTAVPTADPTIAPSLIPTANPTTDPTFEPTFLPTVEPTFQPTYVPTVEPTIPHPSASPTIRPTANPTITFAPTVAPTRQMTPIVSWVTNITLDHVAQPQLDLNGQEAVMATAAYFLKLESKYLTYLGSGPAVLSDARRLQAGQLYSFLVSMRVQVNLAQTPYTSGFLLYNASAPPLEDAVHYGAFDQLIKTNAEVYGAPDLLRASSFQISDSPYAVANPDFSKDENLDLTEGGVAIIVICCLVMFFVILYMAWNSTQKHAPAPGVEHASPKGYALAEDDENTTINKL